jgi:4-amino-4-deoxy-L-arabinose transferase-like glycosyltransferase
MLEYAIQAKHFAREKLIAYIPNRYHAENNFFYVGLHGFSFPLLGTWEYLFSENFGIYDNDYLLRSITGYYGILILVLIYYFMKQYSRFYALSAIILLFSSYGFYLMVTDYHIDTYRIFMILAAFAGLGLAIKHPSNITLILFGAFAAAQAYIHSLGVFIAIFLCLSFFIFYSGKLSQKAIKSFMLFLIIMLFGGVHYVMDVFWGTGWVFQEIKYY